MIELIARVFAGSRRRLALATSVVVFACAPSLSLAVTDTDPLNDTIAGADSLDPLNATGVSISGEIHASPGIGPGDIDHFAFDGVEGDVLNLTLTHTPDPGVFEFFTPILTLIRADDGSDVKQADLANPGDFFGTVIQDFTLPESTRFVIRISSFSVSNSFKYLLAVDAAPVSNVPLPGTLPLLGGALAVAWAVGRRKARAAARKSTKDERPASA